MTELRYWTTGWRPAGRVAGESAGGRLLVLTTDDGLARALAADAVASVEELVAALREPYERVLIVRDAGERDAEEEFLLLFRVTRALLDARREHVRLVYAYTEDRPEYAAAGAFAKVVVAERPTFRYRTVAVAPDAPVATRAAMLLAEFAATDDAVEIRHDGDQRFVRQLSPLPAPKAAPSVRDGGAYLITGGLGGLGRIIAGEFARHARVDLVLTGRRPADPAALAELERLGARVHYVQADVATPDGVATVVAEAKARFGALAGVVHSAGVLRDSFLLRMTERDAAEVLAAKVRGTALLDEVLRDEPLDFFVLFSSLAGTLGNVGQAAYGFANSYLDHYATGRRPWRTVSIAWPMWHEGTMRDDATHDRARTRLGLHSLTTREGVDAFWTALAAGADHVVVIKGEPRTWASLAPAAPAGGDAGLRRRTRTYLVDLVARFTKLPAAEIGTNVSFGRYGIESIMIIAMVEALEGDLGPLSKTLFFEYDSIDELAGHLLDTKATELRTHFGITATPEPAPRVPAPAGHGLGKWDLLVARNRPSGTAAPAEPPAGRADIAVIGLAGRYPQAPDLDTFWVNLRAGEDGVTEVPPRRWDHSRYFDEEKAKPGRTYSRWGGFVDGIELFDPLFFAISPAEAEFLDPQERLFLETAWHAVEDAGYPRRALAGEKVGVFVGVMFGLYQLLSTDQYGGRLSGNSSYASVANRVSYFFDFHGPSMTIDTMCSSSLVAVHQACASIRAGEADLAIAGGVNVISHPAKYVQLSQGTFLSTDGRCRAFGAGGDGYVPGEGVGAVLLKRLDKAIADGDQVHAVIRGSAVNAGGRTSAYTVPNPDAQAELISDALRAAELAPRDISYVEAHGTGTALGDPIEITGLTKAYGRAAQDAEPGSWAIGSVKSNIGHLESAAGIAALTKVILQLRHRQLVPSLHATTLNPLIDFARSPFAVQRELAEWAPTAPDGRPVPRRAAISAFGAGGTNAHLIVEEPPARPAEPDQGGEQVFVLSARDDVTLDALARSLLTYLDGFARDEPAAPAVTADAVRAAVATVLGVGETDIDDDEHYADHGLDAYGLTAVWRELGQEPPASVLHEHPTVRRTAAYLAAPVAAEGTGVRFADLAYTLQVGREPMPVRLAVVASDVDGLRDGLLAHLDRREDVFGVRYGSTGEYERKLRVLLEHEMVGTITRGLLTEGRLDEVAELWVMGAEVDWTALWTDRRPRRLSLPPRPFAREVHWITPVGPDDPLVPAPDAPAGVPAPKRAVVAAVDTSRRDEVLAQLRSCFGAVLRVSPDRLGEHVPFEEFGIDSVSITRLNGLLAQTYGELPTSLLFTYRDLGALAGYLCERPARPVEPRAAEPGVQSGDIAIIGISGRYPMAPTLARFEENLTQGRDCVSEIPAERWDHREYPDVACRWGGFVDDALTFDPSFFGVAPNTAAYMDPQERLFTQSVWHAIEDAGYTPETLTGEDRAVAVYAGVSFNEYALHAAADFGAGQDVPIDSQLYSVANRISYLLNLRGPSLVVDTACSSSLYAIHLACRAIRDGDCAVAVAGGVNLNLHPGKYVTLDMFNFLAPDGHCKSFGAGGNGYVPADGVGAVLLKPLAAAERDGDHIHAVIKGSAVNHGGRTNGYTVPNPVAQAEVVRAALAASGVEPASISYLEAHGTGTQLGDSIEIEALHSVLGTPADRPWAIGSVKSNIGHAEAAAGVSALTKVVLQLRAGRLFPSRLNADRLNPDIDFDRLGFRVQRCDEPWRPPSRVDGSAYPRRAGVSSFGVGGVNVHLVLEEYQGAPVPSASEEPQCVQVSAMNEAALRRYVRALRESPVVPLADLAFTLRAGRRELAHRVAFVARSHAELAERMDAYLSGEPADGVFTGTARSEVDLGAMVDPADADERARRWVAGAWVPEGEAGQRVSLPGYPFEKEKYWMFRAPVRPTAEVAEVAVPAADPVAEVLPEPEPEPEPEEPVDADGEALTELMTELADAFPDERHPLMTAFVQREMAESLGFTEGRLPETDRGFFDLGIDSLSSTEIHGKLERFFGLELDQQLFFNYPTIRDVADYLLDLVDVDAYEPPPAEAAETPPPPAPAPERPAPAPPTPAPPTPAPPTPAPPAPAPEPVESATPPPLTPEPVPAADVLSADIEAMGERELVALLESEIARESGVEVVAPPPASEPPALEPVLAVDVLSADIEAMGERELVALLEGEIARESGVEVVEPPPPPEPPEPEPAPVVDVLSADIEAMHEQDLIALLENEIARDANVRNV